jgi:hypothetical protein
MRPAPDLRPPAPNDRVAPAAGPGLVGYWAFDDGTGTTAEDASPNGNRARLKSGKLEWVDGKYGWAAKLSGDASLVVDKSDSLDSISRTNRLTVSAWIWPNTVGQVDIAFVLSRQLGATGDEVFGLSLWDGKPAFNMQGLVARGPAPVSAQHWVHLAGVYDGARLRVYLDGVEAGTTEATVVTPSDPNPVLISGNVNTENGVTTERKFFDGYVDDVRIYDRALGADEIRALAK